MAKMTKKIRIAAYNAFNNEFEISFQLAGFDNHLQFNAIFDRSSAVSLADGAESELDLLGFTNDALNRIVDEIDKWIEKPRAQLDGLSHGYTMRSRLEVTERLEQERCGKAGAERIVVGAPSIDFAMSALDELERDVASELAWEKIKEVEWVASDRGMLTPPERDAVASQIAAMVAAGLGEEPTVEARKTNFTSLGTLLDNLEAAAHRSTNMPSSSDRLREIQPHRIAIFERFTSADQQDRDIALRAVDKAVDAIHTQAIRFLTPMSLREHDFLRSIIQEEVERVVGGVL